MILLCHSTIWNDLIIGLELAQVTWLLGTINALHVSELPECLHLTKKCLPP